MKIVAIRGCNLASLAGDFDLRLDRGPLASAGLFAITGPTGAGKSTLLDAMCLALFDETPRLASASNAEVGHEDESHRLKARDVRGVVRRGATSAWAEVEFIGQDKGRYVARWAVRRARDRADGRFQDQERTLIDLVTGVRVTGKREVKKAVEDVLGLTFGQFVRSALLAQGEFAAFLVSKADERAELLEKVTGTEIYAELSRAAHQRASEARRDIEGLEALIGEHPVLGDDELAALSSELAEAQAIHVGAVQQLEVLTAAARWYSERAHLLGQEQEARGQVASVEAELQAQAPLQAELVLVVAAEPLRAPLFEADRLAVAALDAEQLVASREQVRVKAEQGRATALETETAARAVLVESDARLEASRPEIAEARRLDGQLAVLQARQAAAVATAAEAGEQAMRAAREAEASSRALADGEATLANARAWLENNAKLEPLAAKWGRWEQLLRDAGSRHHELATRRASLVSISADASRLTDARAAAAQTASRSHAERVRTDGVLRAAVKALEEADKGAVTQERVRLSDERHALDQLRGVAEEAEATHRQWLASMAEMNQAKELARAATTSRDTSRQQQAGADARVEEARLALTRLEAARSLTDRRSALEAGEACPLCGSIDHPWAQEAPVVSQTIAEQRKRLKALEKTAATISREEAQATTRLDEANARTAREAQRETELSNTLEALANTWQRLASSRRGLPALPGATALAIVNAAREAVDGECEQLSSRELAIANLEASIKKAQIDEAHARQRAEDDGVRLQELALAAQKCSFEHDQARREAAALEQAVSTTMMHLVPALGALEAWASEWREDPDGFRESQATLVAMWERYVAERQEALACVNVLAMAQKKADIESQARRTEAARANDLLVTIGSEHADVSCQRLALLSGATADAFAARLETQRQHAADAQQLAALQASKAQSEAVGAAVACDEALRQRELVKGAQAQAEQTLARALDALGLTREVLRERLARGTAWVNLTRESLAANEAAVTAARATLADRETRRMAHETFSAPSLDVTQVEFLRGQFAETAEVSRARLEELRLRFRLDARARTVQAERLVRLEAARNAAFVWEQLNELIGSASGAKFRKYAQGLALTLLTDLANLHLRDLRPRYRLMKVPGEDLELQVVDLDMAGEVRAAQSLSGGETFLVSLALALALSSLASRNARIGTLFIDEGFGSLDPQTLEDAIAALDALQATGRQVGLISHVQGLGERLGVQVQVMPNGGGRSALRVLSTVPQSLAS